MPSHIDYLTSLDWPVCLRWDDLSDVLLFRGSATGLGTYMENQRIRVVFTLQSWNVSDIDIDVGLTGYNDRDKVKKCTVSRNQIHSLRQLIRPRVPQDTWNQYKFHLYLDGNGVASRLPYLLGIGALIFKVESDTVYRTWYSHMLEKYDFNNPYTQGVYFSVKSDLSNLRWILDWCKKNPLLCRHMSMRARRIFEEIFEPRSLIVYWNKVLRVAGLYKS
jgi:hypothetical protein